MNTIEDAQGMKVYFKSTTEEERIREIGKSLEKIDGIQYIILEKNENVCLTTSEKMARIVFLLQQIRIN